jgi:hypothetical protein
MRDGFVKWKSRKRRYVLLFSIFIPTNEKRVPQRIHLGSSTIHQLGQVLVDLSWSKGVLVLFGKFLDDEVVHQGLDVLEVGHVSRGAEDGVVTNGVETLHILESREGTVRRWGDYRERRWGKHPDYAPGLSAAIIMPSLYLIARTLVPVTMGCLRGLGQPIDGLEMGWTDWVCWTPSAKESLTMLGFWWIVYVP